MGLPIMTDPTILDEQELASTEQAESHFTIQMNRVGRMVALGSFAIGTFILLLYLLSKKESLMIIGFYYVLLAGVVNSLVFLLVVFSLFKAKNKKRVLATLGIMLINIPFSTAYFFLAMLRGN